MYLHVNAVGRDVVLRIPTTDLPAEHRAGIPYGTEINFAFRPDLIHLFDPETEKMYVKKSPRHSKAMAGALALCAEQGLQCLGVSRCAGRHGQ